MDRYVDEPCHFEVVLLVGAGLLHVVTELATSVAISRVYNFSIAVLFMAYVARRAFRNPSLLHAWGFRADNFGRAMRVHLVFAFPATVLMLVTASFLGRRSWAPTFWIALFAYFGWGIVQQFALQNLLARNVQHLFSNRFLWAFSSALVFSLSHTPRFTLVALAFVAGLFLTLGHQRQPNLWATGIIHGWLGAVAFYALLGEDPGARILRLVRSIMP